MTGASVSERIDVAANIVQNNEPPTDGPSPWTQLMGRPAVDADPQQTFDNWLAADATAVHDHGLATVQDGLPGGFDEFSFLDNSIWPTPSAFQTELPGDFSVIQDFPWSVSQT
jgi:hypothetical protein